MTDGPTDLEARSAAGDEYDMDQFIAVLLRWGVSVSAVLVAIGGVFYLLKYGSQTPTYLHFHKEPSDLTSVAGIIRDTRNLRRRGLIQLGILILIATPISRIIYSLYSFARRRDFKFVAITGIVLATVVFSLLHGR